MKKVITKKIENSLTIAVGHSKNIILENKKHIARYIKTRKSDNEDYRVIIIDFNNIYSGTKIGIDDITTFKNKVCVIGDINMNKEDRITLINEVCIKFKSGLIVIDSLSELNNSPYILHGLIGCIVSSRTFARDVILSFKSFQDINYMLMQNCSFFRIHDTINFKDTKIINKICNIDIFQLASYILYEKYSNTFSYGIKAINYVIVDYRENKILGCSVNEYLQGYYSYITENLRKINKLNKLDNLILKSQKLNSSLYSDMKHIPISNIYRKILSK